MLHILGVIFYALAGLAAVGALISFQDSGFAALVAISVAISSAFFGAMCMAAETIILTLMRILEHLRRQEPKDGK